MPFVYRLTVTNYKSIPSADLKTRRVNVFIGGPNTGESNLLEALGLLSVGMENHFHEITRAREVADLFSDNDISEKIAVTVNDTAGWTLRFNSQNGHFDVKVVDPVNAQVSQSSIQSNLRFPMHRYPGPSPPGGPMFAWPSTAQSNFRYYSFQKRSAAGGIPQYGYLQPPYGENLPALLYSNKQFRDSVAALFRSKGFRLEVRPHESEILVSKEVNDILYSYPFGAISETLQRIVFYKAAFETNRDAVLILDEPESNTVPFYTKYLAERIALDGHNQFF